MRTNTRLANEEPAEPRADEIRFVTLEHDQYREDCYANEEDGMDDRQRTIHRKQKRRQKYGRAA